MPRFEVSTTGFDSALQGVGADPYNGSSSTGLIVPPYPTQNAKTRYLFLLARIRLGAHRKVRLVGLRQLLTIGATIQSADEVPCHYVLEKQVTSPIFRFQDGNVSWHVHQIPPGNQNAYSTLSSTSQIFEDSLDPALLFKTRPTAPDTYAPPFAGRPKGVALTPSLGSFYDLRFPWQDDQAQTSLNVEIEGPRDIGFFASVFQTNPNTRCSLDLGSLPAGSGSLPPDDAFIANYPGARYWRVGGAMIFEEENFISVPREYVENDAGAWCPPTDQGQGQQDGTLPSPGRGPTPPKSGGRDGGGRGRDR